MTLGMFLGLTLYACTTKTDFTLCGGFLFAFGITMFIAGILLYFTNNPVLHIAYSVFGVILGSLYVLFDT